jgi:hypothetical protein
MPWKKSEPMEQAIEFALKNDAVVAIRYSVISIL